MNAIIVKEGNADYRLSMVGGLLFIERGAFDLNYADGRNTVFRWRDCVRLDEYPELAVLHDGSKWNMSEVYALISGLHDPRTHRIANPRRERGLAYT